MAEKAVLTPEELRNREQREVGRWDGLRTAGAELRREQTRVQAREAKEDGVAPLPQEAKKEASVSP